MLMPKAMAQKAVEIFILLHVISDDFKNILVTLLAVYGMNYQQR